MTKLSFLASSNRSFLISQAFKYEGYDEVNVNAKEAKEILEIELTPLEFGEAMGMKPSSMFVESMFKLMDKVRSNYAKVLYFVQTEPNIYPNTFHQYYTFDQYYYLCRIRMAMFHSESFAI